MNKVSMVDLLKQLRNEMNDRVDTIRELIKDAEALGPETKRKADEAAEEVIRAGRRSAPHA